MKSFTTDFRKLIFKNCHFNYCTLAAPVHECPTLPAFNIQQYNSDFVTSDNNNATLWVRTILYIFYTRYFDNIINNVDELFSVY